MSRFPKPILSATIVVALALCGWPALADDPPKPAPKPMKMKEPMSGEMKKPGMTKGDVKKAAQKKDRDMKEPMEKEEKAMKK